MRIQRTRWLPIALALGLLLTVARPALAQPPILIEGATVHTVSAGVLSPGWVLIGPDGHIARVSASPIEPPAGAERIDGRGSVLTPGLVAVQSALGMVDIWAVRESNAAAVDNISINAAFRAADAFNPRSVALAVSRAEGLTSALIVPSSGVVPGQSAWIDLAGPAGTWGAIVGGPVSLHIAAGDAGGQGAGGSRGALMLQLRRLFDDVRFLQNNPRAFDENRSRALAAARIDLLAIGEFLDGKRPVVFVADRASDIEAVLTFAAEQKLRPIIAGGVEAWMIKERLAALKVPVIVNPLANLPGTFSQLGAREDNAAILTAAGVPVLLSTFDTHNARTLRQFAGNAVRAGMDHDAALRAVPLAPAEAFGQAARSGSIEVGKVAHLVLWSGDPFELETRVKQVWIGGASVSLDNRQTALRRRTMTLQRRDPPALPPIPEDGDDK